MWSDDSARSVPRPDHSASAGPGRRHIWTPSIRCGWTSECLMKSAVERNLARQAGSAARVFGCCGEGETMFRMVTRIIKWISIPVLLIASLFAYCAASYEPLVNLAICLGAIIFVQRAIWV